MTVVGQQPLYKKVPNVVSRGLFLWTLPLFYNALKRDLQEPDLVSHREIFNSKRVGDILEQKWTEELIAAKQKGKEPSLIKAMTKAFWPYYIITGFFQFTSVTLKTVSPLLFAQLLLYWSASGTYTRIEAVYLGIGLVLLNWMNAWFNHQGMFSGQQFGMKMRIAVSSLIFRKVMRLDNGSLGDTEAGKIVNILSNDLMRLDLGFQFLHHVWIIPLQLVAIFYLGYLSAGYAAFIGIGALIVLTLPVQANLSRMFGLFRGKIAVKTDDRIKLMSEVINGIQVIKMYAWEKPFEKIVSMKREAELSYVKKSTYLKFIFIGFMVFTDKIVMFFTILTYLLLGNPFLATVIYPLQQYIDAAKASFTLILPLVFSFTTEMLVALKRVKEFLLQTERPDLVLVKLDAGNLNMIFDETNKKHLDSEPKNLIRPVSFLRSNSVNSESKQMEANEAKKVQSQNVSDIAVQVHNVSCSWVRDPNILTLKNLSLRIPRGKLCAVIGAVGSGKSSFLQLLLKELSPTSGTVTVNGKMAYACQEAWLFPSTVRENILFGEPYDPVKYKKVCKACCLEKDFKQFSHGDQTLVGERGVSLSGGQRARINLARAVYREVDIYMLDDPLSAVDTNVGRELFQGCINGYLKKKTRILVTHQIHFLKNADLIVVLNKGVIENMGTFEELASSGKEFTLMLSQLEEGKDKDADSVNSNTKLDEKPSLTRRFSQLSQMSEIEEEFEAQKQMAEERQSGNLKIEVILSYLRAGGGPLIVITTLLFVLLAAAASSASDFWISYWTNTVTALELEGVEVEPGLSTQVGKFTTRQYLTIYGILVFLCLILTKIKVFPLTRLCTRASYNLHKYMFGSVLNGIMRFFDTSSSGRILNRFAKDMGGIDEQLPRNIVDVLQIYSTIIGVLALNAIAVYYTLIPSFFVMVIFVIFVRIYMRTAQGVKRIEGTTKSPVFGMVTSSLNGISTIRSSGAQARLINDFDNHQDLHTSAWNCYIGGGNAFGFFLDTLCLIYLMIVILFCIFIDMGGLVPVGSVGLIVTQTLTLTIMLQHGARMLVEFFAQMTSVERILEYTKIESETNIEQGPCPIPPNWPSAGRIVFDNVSLKYGPDEKPVLKELNITIQEGWKVGIVGRTGAGKTSLISALFRFAYIDGKISIDGIDTADIGKKQLRTNISIIPQEPVLFSETIRYNMDPFGIYSDEELWRAIELVEMKDAIPSLDYKVTEGGANFSVGQRQLMCLARAVLRSNKVLIMDEATANVDPQTDGFIQQTIRKQFKDCTVLTIAHRLNTIMDSDRVLVMESGRVVEFDHPFNLLNNSGSHFTSMVRETGEKMTAQLFEVAKEAYFTKGQFEDSESENAPLVQ